MRGRNWIPEEFRLRRRIIGKTADSGTQLGDDADDDEEEDDAADGQDNAEEEDEDEQAEEWAEVLHMVSLVTRPPM